MKKFFTHYLLPMCKGAAFAILCLIGSALFLLGYTLWLCLIIPAIILIAILRKVAEMIF